MKEKINNTNSSEHISLKATLREFGLNPADWEIRKIRKCYYAIQSRLENEISFLGITTQTNKTPIWKEIFWTGI